MNTNSIIKYKWFWAWQDDREEVWLSGLARQGLHLQNVAPFGRYTFSTGSPRAMAYRLDFITNARKTPDYFQLFRDAGWEHAGEMGGWQYWRKPVGESGVPEIFTDNASKVLKYQRLIAFLTIFFPIFFINLVNYNNHALRPDHGLFSTVYEIFFFIFFAVMMLIAFNILMIVRRIFELKKK